MKSIFTSIVLCLLIATASAQPAGYNYVLPITITNNANTLITGYQMKMYINTQALISANQMQANGNDIRFGTPCNGDTLFNYYIDSGINTTATKIWVRIDTLQPLQTRTIYMFYGNNTASAASTLSIFNGPFSSTDSITGGTSGGFIQGQRGFEFSPNEDILVTNFGKDEPSGTTRYITLFDNNSQAVILQEQVSGAASVYAYDTLQSSLWLTSGTLYVLEMYGLSTEGYYYQTSSQINSHLTYQQMLYYNGGNQNTFPTSALSGYQYGYPDMLFYTKNNVMPAPGYVTGATGTVNISTQPHDTTVCAGTNCHFSVSALSGTTLYYQWQADTGTGFYNLANATPYSGVTANLLDITDAAINMNNAQYRCLLTSCSGLVVTDTATLTVTPSVVPSVTISASPGVNIAAGTTVTFTASVTNGGTPITYKWEKNGSYITGATNSTYSTNTLANGNVISVVAHSSATCAVPDTAISNALTIHITTGVSPLYPVIEQVALYPNPNNGAFTIKGEVSGQIENVDIEIVNVVGQVIYTDKLPVNNGIIEKQLNLNNVSNGVYIIRVKADEQVKIIQFAIGK